MLESRRGDLSEDGPERVSVQAGMNERRIEVDRVAMTAPLFANVEHPCLPQIAEEAPDSPMG